jgi:hypothetical protein
MRAVRKDFAGGYFWEAMLATDRSLASMEILASTTNGNSLKSEDFSLAPLARQSLARQEPMASKAEASEPLDEGEL